MTGTEDGEQLKADEKRFIAAALKHIYMSIYGIYIAPLKVTTQKRY